MNSRVVFILLVVLIPSINYAQSNSEFGLLPSFNLNKKLPSDWSLNFKVESRQSLIKSEFNYDYLLTDLSLATSKKIGLNTSIAIGYLFRINDNGNKNRAFQQVNYIVRNLNFKLAHRISTDQTFEEDNDPEFRFRYRLSAEIPLNGHSLDAKEFYLKLNNEYLNSFQGEAYDLEVRGTGFIGYVVTPNTKLEFGVDYRIDSFLDNTPTSRTWLGINFYLSI